MQRSGWLDRLGADARILFHKRLRFQAETSSKAENRVEVPLQVGAVLLGYLSIPASLRSERNQAYRRWLEMACRVFADDLSSPHPRASDVLPAKITRAARLMRERFQDHLSLGEIAGEVGLGRERLSRLFHESLGITFSDYLNELRLSEARRRLAEGSDRITEIAYSSGYQSLSQFNRRFKAAEGLSPGQYRKRFAGSAKIR
ncbi:MAG: helix-turn-helix domain-containing protein [Opitutales bacterium]